MIGHIIRPVMRPLIRALTALPSGGAPAPSGWSPADVTLTSSMMGDWWDADATLYADSSATPSTPATANGDPVGTWPSGRNQDIANYAFKALRAYTDNMTYAPSLLVGDATHNRAVRFEGDALGLSPNGSLADVQRGATTRVMGMRIRVRNDSPDTEWGAFGYDNGPVDGPGIGYSTSSGRKWSAWLADTTTPTASSAAQVADEWATVLFLSDSNGSRMYVDDPTTDVLGSAATPSSYLARQLTFWAVTGELFDIHRAMNFGDVDLEEFPVAGVMAWLEANA